MEWAPCPSSYNALKAGSIDGTDVVPHDHAILRAMNSKYTPPSSLKSVPEKTLFIGRLSQTVSEEEVHEVFQKYGRIRSFRFVRDIVTGFPRGYAFVEFERSSSADEAYRRANRKIIDGKEIVVEYEVARTMPGWIPRRLGGGFGGRKESGQLRFGGRDRPFKKPIVEILKNRDRARGPMITKSHIDREKPEKRYEPPRYLSRDSLYSSKTRCTRSLSRSRIMEYKKEKHHQMSKDRSQSRSNRRRSRSVSLERSDNEKVKLHKSSLKHSRSRSRERERKVNKSDYKESEIRHRSKKKKHKKEKRHKKKKRVSHSPLGSKASDGKDYKKDKSDSP